MSVADHAIAKPAHIASQAAGRADAANRTIETRASAAEEIGQMLRLISDVAAKPISWH
jgi:hypothetical protein